MNNIKKELMLQKEISETFTYIKSEIYNGIEFEIYNDDCGQCYILAWRTLKDNSIKTWSCGPFNSYERELVDIAEYEVERYNKRKE